MKFYRFLVLLCILPILAACADAKFSSESTLPSGTTQSTEPESIQIPYSARFVELTPDQGLSFEPVISVIRSKTELQAYCEENKLRYFTYSDSGSSIADFAELCTGYDDLFFQNSQLILLSFSEPSISTTHEISEIAYQASGQMGIFMNAINDGFLLDRAANWCCILEIDAKYLVDTEDITVDISVLNYPNGRPADS